MLAPQRAGISTRGKYRPGAYERRASVAWVVVRALARCGELVGERANSLIRYRGRVGQLVGILHPLHPPMCVRHIE